MDPITGRTVIPFKIEESAITSDDNFFYFKGYGSTFRSTSDSNGDLMLKGAFAESIQNFKSNKKILPVLWLHDRDMPLGIYTNFFEDDKGLFVEGKLPKEDTFVSGRVIPQMKVGSVSEMSIGWTSDLWRFVGEGHDAYREVERAGLLEVSLVTANFAANDEAKIIEHNTKIQELNGLKLRELEHLFKSGIKFSGNDSRKVISALKSSGLIVNDVVEIDNKDNKDIETINRIVADLKSMTV